jgi:hypothetical protein
MVNFDEFKNENVTLKKKNGERYEDIMASVQPDMIFIDNASLPIEEEDIIIRKLPNGLVEKYKVLDRGFYKKIASMPAHYQVKVQKFTGSQPKGKDRTVYNLGDNSRVNINSKDSSVNIINMNSKNLFTEIKSTVKSEVENNSEKEKLLNKIDELEKAQNSSNFPQKYAEFMALAANHATILSPFLPALGQLLTS